MSEEKKLDTRKSLLAVLTGVSAYLLLAAIAAALIYDGFDGMFQGFWTILTSPSKLTIDYFLLGSLSGTFLNMSIVGFFCCLILGLSGFQLNGPSVMAYFLTVGFSAFGMNALNIWPIILGTFLFALYKKEKFAKYVNFSLFATALAPFVSEALFADYGLHVGARILLALAGGIFIGFVMPGITVHMVGIHKGFNMFNAGLSAGFLGFLLFAITFNTLGNEKLETTMVGEGYKLFCAVALYIFFALCILGALWLGGGEVFKTYFKGLFWSDGYKKDYTAEFGVPAVVLNMGIYGAFVTLYYLLVGGNFTGPTVGCVFCMLSLIATSAHPRNVYPIMIGYILVSLIPLTVPVTTQAILVGLCFATGLAPIAGVYGPILGIVAGMIHCGIVTSVPAIHGGFNLYNGGFTAGLVCVVLVPLLEIFFRTKEERKAARAGTQESQKATV